MNYTLKLLIPLALGLAAAAINWSILSSGTTPVAFVTVKETVEMNQPITLDQLEPLLIPKDFASLGPQGRPLSSSMVPFEDRGVLSGRKARRKIEPGDPIFFADTDLGGAWLDLEAGEELFPVSLDNVSADPTLLRIGNSIHFRVPALPDSDEDGPRWLGPFRIVAVGAKTDNNFSDNDIGSGADLAVGIAYNKKNADKNARLEKFCDDQKRGMSTLLGIRLSERR